MIKSRWRQVYDKTDKVGAKERPAGFEAGQPVKGTVAYLMSRREDSEETQNLPTAGHMPCSEVMVDR